MWQGPPGFGFPRAANHQPLQMTSADTSPGQGHLSRFSKGGGGGGGECRLDTGGRTKAPGLHVTDGAPPLTTAVPIPGRTGPAEVHLSAGGACQGFV